MEGELGEGLVAREEAVDLGVEEQVLSNRSLDPVKYFYFQKALFPYAKRLVLLESGIRCIY